MLETLQETKHFIPLFEIFSIKKIKFDNLSYVIVKFIMALKLKRFSQICILMTH